MADDTSELTEQAPVFPRDVPHVRRFVLEVVEGPTAGLQWTSQGDRCALGSHPSNDLVIEDKAVSRFHCEIRIDGQTAWLRDLGSLNGTSVDGVVVREARLRNGSLIRMGRSALQFQLASESAPLPVATANRFGSLVGSSIGMRAAFYLLERAAATDATVLLQGETGSGKDAAAESIHQASARRDGPFVVVDCGAIPENLIESELFGHERGAFTGAVAKKQGVFEAANQGSVFLDEIGELPLELQPKLLRVLEQRTVRHVGAHEQIPIDVRIIAATNRDLRTEVNEGRFRADLYYRLAVISIRMPPLRERPEDIPELVDEVVAGMDADPDDVAKIITPELVARLQTATWRGNVRELRNYLERCLVLHRPPPLQAHAGDTREPSMEIDARLSFASARRQSLDRFEKLYVQALLERHEGNVSQEGRAADMNRVYLHRLLRRHGLRG
jgi:two-component system, NtrC family, response regulator GlrR